MCPASQDLSHYSKKHELSLGYCLPLLRSVFFSAVTRGSVLNLLLFSLFMLLLELITTKHGGSVQSYVEKTQLNISREKTEMRLQPIYTVDVLRDEAEITVDFRL